METPDHPFLRLILDGEAARVLHLHGSAADPSPEDDRWGGYACYLMADYLGARDLLGRAVSRGCGAARIELATVYRHLGEAALARRTLRGLDGWELTPFDRALAERERGVMLLGEGHLVEAVSALEQVWVSVQDGPTAIRASTALALGTTHAQLGQDLRAVHVLNAAIAMTTGAKRGYPLATRGLSRVYGGDYVGAEQDFQEARTYLEAVPALASSLAYDEGVLRRAQGRYGDALCHFRHAVVLAGPEGELSFFAELQICAVHTALGQTNEATAALARASRGRAEPRQDLFWQWRAAALAAAQGQGEARRLEEVRDAFSVLGLLRETGWVCLHLSESHLRQGQVQGASAALNRATDVRHQLGSGAALATELRDLTLVRQWLEHQQETYSRILLDDWRALKGCAPVQITLITLGDTRILADGQAVPMRLRRSVEILVYLLDHGPTTREQLLTALWPESAPRDAANYFHQVKNKLESALPGLTIPYHAAGGTYSVQLQGPRLNWDVTDVKRLLNAGDDDSVWEAIQAYSGAFLPGASVTWAQEERRALEWSVVKAGLRLIDRWNAEGQSSKCLELALRLREIEPYNEVLAEYLVVATLELEGHIAARRALDDLSSQFKLEVGEVPPRLLVLERRLTLAS